MIAANFRGVDTGARADLAKTLNQFQSGDCPVFFGTEFPNRDEDLHTVCDKMAMHATGKFTVGY